MVWREQNAGSKNCEFIENYKINILKFLKPFKFKIIISISLEWH